MKKQIIALFSLLLLVSCENKEQTSSESIPDTTGNTSEKAPTESSATSDSTASSESENKSDAPATKKYTFTNEDIPETGQSKYNNEFDFSHDGFDLFGDYMQRGTGDYANTIQMKKGVSYFYNKTMATGTITLSVLDKGEYTGVPTIYVGNTENPTESIEWESKKQESNAIIYTAKFTNYFKVSDESSYALYLNYFEIEA